MSNHQLTIPEHLSGERVDKALSQLLSQTSRSQIQKAIKSGNLTVNGLIISDFSVKVKDNDHIELCIIETPQEGILPADIKLDIVYEDEDLMVINKPVGMTVHPGAGDKDETLVNALLFYTKSLSDIGGEFRPGIVHRLDKDTSGLMVVAKNNHAHASLAEQIETRQLVRKYKALVWGSPRPLSGTIDINIGRSRVERTKMTTLKSGGKRAITHYSTLEIFGKGLCSFVECRLETGRTHQIRVHMSHIGHSIVGDQTYGNNKRKINSAPEELKTTFTTFGHQALHSFYINFLHPVSGQELEFFAELPEDYNKVLEILRQM